MNHLVAHNGTNNFVRLNRGNAFPINDGIPEVNMDLSGFETISLSISRGRLGFGFTVFGSSPVQVGRVDEGSPAYVAGLRRNDCLVRINGQNVSRSTAESVAKIVRETERVLRLEAQRATHVTDGTSPIGWWSSSSCVDESFGLPATETSAKQQQQQQQQRSVAANKHCPAKPTRLAQQRRPFTSLVNNTAAAAAASSQDLKSFFSSLDNHMDQLSSFSFESSFESDRCSASDVASMACPRRASTARQAPAPPSTDVEGQPGDATASKNEVDESIGSTESSKVHLESNVGIQSTTADDKILYPSMQALISCEENFVLTMQLGVRRYLTPLQEAFLSLTQHWTVFQNLEEIISLSQFHVQELHRYTMLANPSDQTVQHREPPGECRGESDALETEGRLSIGLHALVSVYLTELDSLCVAYESYCPRIMDSLRFLASLKKSNPELQDYLRKAQDSDKFSISAFLQKPIEHLKELVLALQKILCYTKTTTSEYAGLKRIVQSMRNCCSKINTTHIQRSTSSSSSFASVDSVPMKSASSSLSSSSSSSSSSPASVTVSNVVSSIDSEVLEIQTRLVFPENVRTFHLATASHHMVYSGRLALIEGASSTQLFVALLSDLLLLTRPDPVGEALYVLEEPIVLHDVVGCNFSRAHICEFVISIETPLKSLQNSWTPRALVMRAPSVEMKNTWKNILEQRIAASKTQREVTVGNRFVDKIV